MRTSLEQTSYRGVKAARKVAADEGWEIRNQLFYKDNAEIYLYRGGFELIAKKPDGDEHIVLEVDHLDTASPHYAAVLMYALRNHEHLILLDGELCQENTQKQ